MSMHCFGIVTTHSSATSANSQPLKHGCHGLKLPANMGTHPLNLRTYNEKHLLHLVPGTTPPHGHVYPLSMAEQRSMEDYIKDYQALDPTGQEEWWTASMHKLPWT